MNFLRCGSSSRVVFVRMSTSIGCLKSIIYLVIKGLNFHFFFWGGTAINLSLLDWDGGFPSALAGAAGLPAHPSPLPSSASSEAASGSNLAAIFQTGVRRMRLRQLMGGRGEHARAGKFCSAHACGAVCSLAQDESKGVSASLWLSDMRL